MLFMKQSFTRHTAPEFKLLQRQALSGLLWSKQYYHFDVEKWLTTSDGISSGERW